MKTIIFNKYESFLYEKAILIAIFIVFMTIICQGQNSRYPNEIKSKVKISLGVLYPNASGFEVQSNFATLTTQKIVLKCNCQESPNPITLTFDTTGILLNKSLNLKSIEELPEFIVKYIKDSAANMQFGNTTVKNINTIKNDTTYFISLFEKDTKKFYTIKFSYSGKVIYKKQEPTYRW